MEVQIARPASAVHSATGVIGLAGFITSLAVMIALQADSVASTYWMLLGSALPMIAFEAWLAWRGNTFFASVGRNTSPDKSVNWPRVITKLLGFGIAWFALWSWFEWVPVYRRPDYFRTLTQLDLALPWLAAIGAIYVIWCDRQLAEPHDGSWHAGRLIASLFDKFLLPAGDVPRTDLMLAADFFLGWFIKGFFLVFLISVIPGNLDVLKNFPTYSGDDIGRFFFWATNFLFTLDVVIGTLGYACTFKPLNSHIRSVNPTVLGWVAALACYTPFVIIGPGNLLDFQTGGTYWNQWLQNAPDALKWGWVIAMVVCVAIYTSATLAFGIRFSNLTDRGILTHGAYRLMRHPAYVSKNTFWWLLHVPWINQIGTLSAIKCCLMLLAVNMLYGLRAWTEEQHLIKDPNYKQYKDWMKSRSLWQRLRD